MRKGHPWDDLIFRALRHAWLFDAYVTLIGLAIIIGAATMTVIV